LPRIDWGVSSGGSLGTRLALVLQARPGFVADRLSLADSAPSTPK